MGGKQSKQDEDLQIEFDKKGYLFQMRAKQFLPISKEEAWEFLSTPMNLDDITPPDLGFEILSGADKKCHAG